MAEMAEIAEMTEIKESQIGESIQFDFICILNLLKEEKNSTKIIEILNKCLQYLYKFKSIYQNIKIESNNSKTHLQNFNDIQSNLLNVCSYIEDYINFSIWPDYNNQAQIVTFSNIFPYFDVTRTMQGNISIPLKSQVISEINKLTNFKGNLNDFIGRVTKNIGTLKISNFFEIDFDVRDINYFYDNELNTFKYLMFDNIIRLIKGKIEIFTKNNRELKELEDYKPNNNTSLHF